MRKGEAAHNRKTIEQKLIDFHNSYITEPNSGCWIWIGAMKGSYGGFSVGGQYYNAQRAAWILLRGKIKNSKVFVLHKCDVRVCVNPDHLFLGSNSDNMKDMVAKGKHWNWKFNLKRGKARSKPKDQP